MLVTTHNTSKTPAVIEEGRRSTEGTTGVPAPDPEVKVRHTRRSLTISYKIRIVNTVSTLRTEGHGAIGAFLRKEGLYYSMATRWERQLAEGKLISPNRSPQEKSRTTLLEENKQLKRKLDRLEHRLAKTEMIVELQKNSRRSWNRFRATKTQMRNDHRTPSLRYQYTDTRNSPL